MMKEVLQKANEMMERKELEMDKKSQKREEKLLKKIQDSQEKRDKEFQKQLLKMLGKGPAS